MTIAPAPHDQLHRHRAKIWAMTGLVLVLGLAAVSTNAQSVYRSVGPDGRVTYSDQPPPVANATPVSASSSRTGTDSGAQLPFQLRQVVARYPVTLYSTKDCAPCNSGRNLLSARGIPYTEKLVETREDGEALMRVSGQASLPLLTIGGQQIKGYSDTEWTQFLDAAGYPKTSALPGNYRRPAPTPLVAAEPAPAAPVAGTPASNTASPAQPVEPPANNPAGIRF